jgi:hypothetical protein
LFEGALLGALSAEPFFLIWLNWFQVTQLKLRISKRNIKAVIEVFKYFNTA